MSEMVDQSSDWSRNLINPLQGGVAETSALASTSQRQHLNKGFLNLKLMEEKKDVLELTTKTVNINGVEMRCTVLADAVWQGVKYMSEECLDKETSNGRRGYLYDRIKESAFYHYIILGCSKEEAKIMAEQDCVSLCKEAVSMLEEEAKKKEAGKAE